MGGQDPTLVLEYEPDCGLTKNYMALRFEAASACLRMTEHPSTVAMGLSGFSDTSGATLVAQAIDDDVLRSHREEKEATRLGSEGVAILLVSKLAGLVTFEVSVHGTRFDYWVYRRNAPKSLIQEQLSLEISGILRERKNNSIEGRIKEKQDRLKDKPKGVDVYIVVVEFGQPQARMVVHGC